MRGQGHSLLSRAYPTIFRVLLAAVMLAAASFIAGPSQTAVRADGPNRAGLVVQFGDGSVWTACISFPEQELTSLELLRRSGLRVLIEDAGVYGGAVCKIQGDGCDFPMQSCFCQCEGAECTYWAYYHLGPDGTWQYSTVGSSTYRVRNGSVEGWAWGPGDYGFTGARPPAVTFDQVCPPPATMTPTPTPQPSPTPTFTPAPSATSTAAPAHIEFWADRTEIAAGQCLNLGWRVAGVQAVFLDSQGVIGEEVRQVCPTQDTTYTLRAITSQGEEVRQIRVHVVPATPTATLILPPAALATQPSTPAVPTLAPTRLPTSLLPTATPASPLATHTPMALAMSQPEALPPSPTFTPLPATDTPAATVVAFLPPAPTPKVWARAEAPDNVRTHLPAAATPEPYAAPAGDVGQDPPPRLLFDYSLFFFCAALMAALTTWAARRHMR